MLPAKPTRSPARSASGRPAPGCPACTRASSLRPGARPATSRAPRSGEGSCPTLVRVPGPLARPAASPWWQPYARIPAPVLRLDVGEVERRRRFSSSNAMPRRLRVSQLRRASTRRRISTDSSRSMNRARCAARNRRSAARLRAGLHRAHQLGRVGAHARRQVVEQALGGRQLGRRRDVAPPRPA